MLLRTVLLLSLCVSVATGATLGLYQAQAQEDEEEAPAVTGDAVGDIDAGVDSVAPADVQADDPPAAEEPESNPLIDDNVATQAQDNQEADKPEVKADDPPAAEEPESNSLIDDNVAAQAKSNQDADKPADVPAAEESDPGSDGPAGDAPALTVTQEQPTPDAAISHDQPSSSSDDAATQENPSDEAVNQVNPDEEEEDNEIKPVPTEQSQSRQLAQEESSWSLNSIRNSFQTMHGYFDSLVELVGGQNGVCQYRCRYGEIPKPRPGYQLPEPDGCSSSLVGFEFDLGIPAMTNCCNELDLCYDTCGMSKYDCDTKFRSCLHNICSDVNKSLGFVKKVEACESMADTLFNTVWTLGCRPYMNSQRAACVCEEEERDEL